MIIFIRHGKTKGNEEKRYIGTTDEELSLKGIEEIKKNSYPGAEIVVSSPLKRCIQTAQLIYGRTPEIFRDLRECSFGDFENKNYDELKYNEDYTAWLESNGRMPFPNGEEHGEFCQRCCKCFEGIVNCYKDKSIAFVVHGGTIMAILEKYALEKRSFYDWQIGNGQYLIFEKTDRNDNIKLRLVDITRNIN